MKYGSLFLVVSLLTSTQAKPYALSPNIDDTEILPGSQNIDDTEILPGSQNIDDGEIAPAPQVLGDSENAPLTQILDDSQIASTPPPCSSTSDTFPDSQSIIGDLTKRNSPPSACKSPWRLIPTDPDDELYVPEKPLQMFTDDGTLVKDARLGNDGFCDAHSPHLRHFWCGGPIILSAGGGFSVLNCNVDTAYGRIEKHYRFEKAYKVNEFCCEGFRIRIGKVQVWEGLSCVQIHEHPQLEKWTEERLHEWLKEDTIYSNHG